MRGVLEKIDPAELYGLIDAGESLPYYFKADDVDGGIEAFKKLHVGEPVTFDDAGEVMFGGKAIRAENVQ